MKKNKINNFILLPLSLTILFYLAPKIDAHQHEFYVRKGIFKRDMLYEVLGEGRKILSDYASVKGDEYLHGGITGVDKAECKTEHHKHNDLEHERVCPVCHQDHDPDKHIHKKDKKPIRFSRLNILPYIGGTLHITEHIHLHGEEEKEILPWFYYAVKLNPKNVEAYVTGGFWVGIRLDRPDEGIKFLKEGLVHNSDSWEIYQELGHIYLTEKKDPKKALSNFLKAYELIPVETVDKFDKRGLYTFIAGCYGKLGYLEKEAEFYKKVLELFPGDKAILKKLSLIEEAP